MSFISVSSLRERNNLILVHMRSSYQNGIFKINETHYPVDKVNRANIRYNEVYDYRISHLNTVMPDKIAYGCYEVYVLICDDDKSDMIKYRQKLASSTALDLNIRKNSIENDLHATLSYIENQHYKIIK